MQTMSEQYLETKKEGNSLPGGTGKGCSTNLQPFFLYIGENDGKKESGRFRFFVINTSFTIFVYFSESEINYICELIVWF